MMDYFTLVSHLHIAKNSCMVFQLSKGVGTYRKKEKMAMYVVDDFKGYKEGGN